MKDETFVIPNFLKRYQSNIFLSQRKKEDTKDTKLDVGDDSLCALCVSLCFLCENHVALGLFLKIRDDSCLWAHFCSFLFDSQSSYKLEPTNGCYFFPNSAANTFACSSLSLPEETTVRYLKVMDCPGASTRFAASLPLENILAPKGFAANKP